jgi:ubiquinone/menaquinone biosynthesis C-methylase UbiE
MTSCEFINYRLAPAWFPALMGGRPVFFLDKRPSELLLILIRAVQERQESFLVLNKTHRVFRRLENEQEKTDRNPSKPSSNGYGLGFFAPIDGWRAPDPRGLCKRKGGSGPMSSKEWDTKRILEVSGSYWETCTLHAAVRLELFTLIGEDGMTAKDIAGGTGTDFRAVTMLLNALSAMGLLIKDGEHYANTQWSKSFLTRYSPHYIGYMVSHHHHLVPAWSRLHESVKTGGPQEEKSASEEEERESFLMGMFNLAMGIAPGLAKQIDLGGKKHLLDLGGGPGTYAIHFCLENPHLRATVFDLPSTRPFAVKTIEKFGLTDRIDFMEGNYLEDNIPGTYDVVWLSHILHAEGPSDCQMILDKTVRALAPGGFLFIHDFVLEDTFDGPLFPALFSLNMLLNTKRGQAYGETQIREMLGKAGLRNIRRLDFEGPNSSGIIQGEL